MSGWYELSKSADGQYRFVLKAGNDETVLVSERYKAKQSALDGIASCQTNSPADGRYRRLLAQDGRPYFVLKATNGRVIGSSQMYAESSSREAGIEAVKANGPSKTIRVLP